MFLVTIFLSYVFFHVIVIVQETVGKVSDSQNIGFRQEASTVCACLKTNWVVIVGQTMKPAWEVRDSGLRPHLWLRPDNYLL